MTAATIINLTATIVINQDHQLVFDYLADYAHDKTWRKEIKEVTLNPAFIAIGTSVTEISFLSKKVPDYASSLVITDFQPYQSITSETIAENRYWAKNTREVAVIGNNKTKVTYNLQFEMDIVKYGLGFSLPKFLVSFYTKMTMKKYLSILKSVLESRSITTVA